MSQTIDRESPVPYYEQLFGILRDRIVDGAIPADERLPSELELCREYGLSRATVRQTMSKLETEGFARRVARRGVFASAPREPSGWTVQDTQGFLDSQLAHGRRGVTTEVLEARFTTPPARVREALRLGAADRAFALRRRRSLDGVVAMFSTNWLPDSVGAVVADAPDVLDGTGSLDSTLRRAGYVTAGARRLIDALRAPDDAAESLRIDAGDPVLRVRSWSWAQNDLRFDYYETWVLTDVVPLEVNVAAV